MSELLLEIFSEEIPARLQNKATANLQTIFAEQAAKAALTYKQIQSYATPRRLVLAVSDIKQSSQNTAVEKKGPRIDAPEEAINGFLKTNNLSKKDLEIREIKGQQFYFASVSTAIQSLQETIMQVINQIFATLPWPKTMRWEESNIRWIRPIRNILCIFEGRVVPISFGSLIANNHTYGHRFMAGQTLTIKDFADYQKQLNTNKVFLSQAERRASIVTQASSLAHDLGLSLVVDDELLDEIAGLVEYPVALAGKIDREFLQLPNEVLVCTMKTHQRYLALVDARGDFAPYFIVIANVVVADMAKIVAGNERVLRARLHDAKFFYEQDQKRTLASRIDDLRQIVFHTKCGSVYDKTQRIVALIRDYIAKLHSLNITNNENLVKAAQLAKTDLTTNMVKEFPELQGVIGKYYALNDKENSVVAEAIFEHYLPVGRSDKCPVSIEGAFVSIADKIDSIIGLFYAGEPPTSSKDPYGLRRSALGVIRIVIEHKIYLDLAALIASSIALYKMDSHAGLHPPRNDEAEDIAVKIRQFFYERFKYFLKDQFRYDLISAVREGQNLDIYTTYRLIASLEDLAKTAEGKAVYGMLNRVYNFTKSSALPPTLAHLHIDIKLLEGAETKLYETTEQVRQKVDLERKNENFANIFKALEPLVESVNEFCDNVMVMVDDPKLREQRLNLLLRVRFLLGDLVDFSVIEF